LQSDGGGSRAGGDAPNLVSLIVAYDGARVIGRDGGMPWHLPADLAHFKTTTMGHSLIVGRKTFESIGRALPGRRMIVVSRGRPTLPAGVELVDSLEGALELGRSSTGGEVFVAGGGEIYRRALPLAGRLYVTHIGDLPGETTRALPGDTLFPAWDATAWIERECRHRLVDAANPRPLDFCVYDRRRD
jgi:dihydrofolate reductase